MEGKECSIFWQQMTHSVSNPPAIRQQYFHLMIQGNNENPSLNQPKGEDNKIARACSILHSDLKIWVIKLYSRNRNEGSRKFVRGGKCSSYRTDELSDG